MKGGSGHAESESTQDGSCKQLEKTINEAPDTLTGTTGKAGPKGLGVDRTGIAGPFAFLLSLVVEGSM